MKDFGKNVRLKRTILMFLAHRADISREEISKQRKIFLKLDANK